MPLADRAKNVAFAVITIVLLIFIAAAPAPAASTTATLELTAAAAVLMDRATGEILFAKNPDERKAPASTTKILTALIALEKGHLNDLITVGANPPRVEGTRVYLVEGEEVTLENLLYAMLLNSGNDAALAIAEHYGGSQEGFARLMNEKAAALGARDSHFVTPNGLSEPGHYTTARDLATIARAAMENETFRRIVATKTRPWHGREWETTLINQNKLLWNYEGADGVKNGYTSDARFTLVGAASRQGQGFIAVVLDEPSSREAEKDVAALLDYGFKEFRSFQLAREGEVMGVIDPGNGKKVELVAAGDLAVVRKNDNGAGLPAGRLEIHSLRGPLAAGTRVGEMVFLQDGEIIGRVDIINRQAIPARPLSPGDWWLRLSLAMAVLFVLYRRVLVRRQRRRVIRSRVFSDYS
ncbi:D-alanyl-D-alanine carboxypeptidase family protein [Moorella sulfitireducens]|uniref:D-alanyl-D-alanine carboxypeptidase family protein n=1 Tax=Neomoorella sulfitireducens TaxID=2972948 RepID=UPI0021AC6D22|nr:D-alanyl-D-alanine carboxypeptidase family protein [Moorella sulfitireducens]